MRTHHQVDNAGLLVLEEDLLPVLPSIFAAVDAAFPTGTKRIADRCHINEIWILWMDANAGNVSRLFQPEVVPGLPGVRRLIDPVSPGHAVTQLWFSRADIDHLRLAAGHRNGAHRTHIDLAVRQRFPVLTGILGLPDATGRVRVVEHVAIRGMHLHTTAPSAHKRAHAPPLQ